MSWRTERVPDEVAEVAGAKSLDLRLLYSIEMHGTSTITSGAGSITAFCLHCAISEHRVFVVLGRI
jgi:hypothetical protein